MLLEAAKERLFERSEYLVHQGDVDDSVYLVARGVLSSTSQYGSNLTTSISTCVNHLPLYGAGIVMTIPTHVTIPTHAHAHVTIPTHVTILTHLTIHEVVTRYRRDH